jgi:hypothetical protein
MKCLNFVFIVSTLVGLVGCGEGERDPKINEPSPISEDGFATSILNQEISGEVRGVKFDIEQAIVNNGTLALRRGKEFFADTSVEVILFDHDDLEAKAFTFPDSNGQFKPHIRLGIKKEGASLPDEITLTKDYELQLLFGKKKNLGIPFTIKLVSLQNNTHIEGKSFATYENIKVTDGLLDVQFDSFDTLKYLAREYIETSHAGAKPGDSFGISYKTYGNGNPKTGFVGYEIRSSAGEESTIKLQLAKDDRGWKVVNQLTAAQIDQAHPVLTNIKGNLRTVEGEKANQMAAQALETYLNETKIMGSVRKTSVYCYLTKSAHKASCNAVYGLKVEKEVQCHSKNYLLKHEAKKWTLESEILDTQKVDYITGELVTTKPRSMMCK